MGSASISVDEFQALEQKVLQTVELIKREREARAAAEAEVVAVQAELANAQGRACGAWARRLWRCGRSLRRRVRHRVEMQSLQREREAVRVRVEKMLASIEEVMSA